MGLKRVKSGPARPLIRPIVADQPAGPGFIEDGQKKQFAFDQKRTSIPKPASGRAPGSYSVGSKVR